MKQWDDSILVKVRMQIRHISGIQNVNCTACWRYALYQVLLKFSTCIYNHQGLAWLQIGKEYYLFIFPVANSCDQQVRAIGHNGNLMGERHYTDKLFEGYVVSIFVNSY